MSDDVTVVVVNDDENESAAEVQAEAVEETAAATVEAVAEAMITGAAIAAAVVEDAKDAEVAVEAERADEAEREANIARVDAAIAEMQAETLEDALDEVLEANTELAEVEASQEFEDVEIPAEENIAVDVFEEVPADEIPPSAEKHWLTRPLKDWMRIWKGGK